MWHEDESQAAFRREALARVEETRAVWESYAQRRNLRFVASSFGGMPAFEGRLESTDVQVAAVGSVELGFRTRATTEAKSALRGSVYVGPPGEWDEIVKLLRKGFFSEPELDRLLIVKASSRSLARGVLDERLMTTVRALAPGRLQLSYAASGIAVEWAGIERNFGILDDVLDALVHLALRRDEASPYR